MRVVHVIDRRYFFTHHDADGGHSKLRAHVRTTLSLNKRIFYTWYRILIYKLSLYKDILYSYRILRYKLSLYKGT